MGNSSSHSTTTLAATISAEMTDGKPVTFSCGGRRERGRERYYTKKELAALLEKSKDKECEICYSKVLEIPSFKDQCFGILSDCRHVFCYRCISDWRMKMGAKLNSVDKPLFECPTCRTPSGRVISSRFWIEEKDKAEHLKKLSKLPCKNFKFGKGYCRLGTKCFYSHLIFATKAPQTRQ